MTWPKRPGKDDHITARTSESAVSRSSTDMQEDMMDSWRPLLLGYETPAHFDLDSYLPSRANSFLADIVTRICDGRASSVPTPIYLYGVPGIGKTHLLCAIARGVGAQSLLIHVADLEAEIARARRKGFLAECYRWVFGHDIVMFDDVQYAAGNDAIQTEVTHLLDQLLLRQRSVLVSAKARPEHLDIVDAHLVSILMGGIILKMEMCEEDERLTLLRRAFDRKELPDDIAYYLARNVTDSVRHLKAAAEQLIAMKRQTGSGMTIDMARAIAPLPEDLRHPSTPPPPPGPDEDDEPAIEEDRASFFREMLDAAENEEEQALALQIALGQRLREIRNAGGNEAHIDKLEHALTLLREGKLEDALKCTADSVR